MYSQNFITAYNLFLSVGYEKLTIIYTKNDCVCSKFVFRTKYILVYRIHNVYYHLLSKTIVFTIIQLVQIINDYLQRT